MVKTGTIKRMKLAELVEDFDLYPRHGVDSQHVSYLAQAIGAGASVPPLVAWKDGNRIIDGQASRGVA